MKSTTRDSQSSRSSRKREFAVFFIGWMVLFQAVNFLCRVINLPEVVFLAGAVVSLLNAIYYCFIGKSLKKSWRIGLGLLFGLLSLIDFLLYGIFIQGDGLTQSKLIILAQFFGLLSFGFPLLYIYKRKALQSSNEG